MIPRLTDRVCHGQGPWRVGGRPEQGLELAPQYAVDLGHRGRTAEIGEAGHAIERIGDAARHDAGEMGEVRRDVERDAVQADPALEPDPDGRDLVLAVRALAGLA